MGLSNFEIINKIGEGAYSSVFKVIRKSDNENYALKQINFSSLDKKDQENALTEIRVLASVNHPNIISYKEAFYENDYLYIVMELAEEGDLLRLIKEHKKNKTHFREAEIWRMFTQIVQGLKTLHDLKIVHRDLKPANIFIGKEKVLKIGDMNIAKVIHNGMTKTQLGTPFYSSPEVWKESAYDIRTDLWSLGCILYEMCVLRSPFCAQDLKTVYSRVVKARFAPLPMQYSDDLSLMISELLKVNPLARPLCHKILKGNIIQKHAFCFDSLDNQLLKTIYSFAELPRSCYHRYTTIHQKKTTPNVKLPALKRSSKSIKPRIQSYRIDSR